MSIAHIEADEAEREANYFAMCLLMPEKFVRKWLADNCPKGFDLADDGDLKRIANAFGVSTALAAVRLADLKVLAI